MVGVLIALILAELFVRVFFPHARDHALPSGMVQTDATLGWKLSANQTKIHHTRYFEVEYQTNSLGCRDHELEAHFPESKKSVIFLGDSQIFGWGVPQSSRFSDVIANDLPDWNTYNCAVPGYGLGQMVLTLEQMHDLKVDQVVIFLSPVILGRIEYSRLFNRAKPMFYLNQHDELRLKLPEYTVMYSLLYQTLSGFYLPYFITKRWNLITKFPAKYDPVKKAKQDPQSKFNLDLSIQLLDKALTLSRQRGQRLIILAKLDDPYFEPIYQWLQEESVPYLNIEIDRGDPTWVHGKGDTHFNSKAHRYIADKWIQFLHESSLNPPILQN